MFLTNQTSAALVLASAFSVAAHAESPTDLNDLEIAHVAYTADSVDIRYAHLALAMPAACEEEQVGRRRPTIYTARG